MKRKFVIPKTEEVNERNRRLFFGLEESMGFVPNLYAFMTYSDPALKSFLNFSATPTAFSPQEVIAIQLVTSQVNNCLYCLSAHTAQAKQAGFTDEQIIAIRKGNVDFDEKLDTLTDFACELVSKRGEVDFDLTERFYGAGYTNAHLVDLTMIVAQTTMMNYLYGVIQCPIDFPKSEVVFCNCDCKQ